MINVVVFDVDGTLRMPNHPLELDVVKGIHRLLRYDKQVSLVSGKNVVYLFGLAEGIGIPNPLVAGENGAVIFRPLEKTEIVYPVSDETANSLDYVMSFLKQQFKDDIWSPQNRCGRTAFVRPGLPVDRVYDAALGFIERHRITNVYALPHWDAVDILPWGLDKGVFIEYLEEIGYLPEEVIAVGDALNDIPMLEAAGHSITFEYSSD